MSTFGAPGQPRSSNAPLVVAVSIAVVLLLACCVGGGVLAFTSSREDSGSGTATRSAVPRPAHVSADHSGIVVGDGPVAVELYLDLQCPVCRNFEATAGDTIHGYVTAKKITLTVYLLTFLDRVSPNAYSSRAAAAAACAADGDRFLEYTAALYAAQPEEGTAGPGDDELVATGRSVGLGEPFADCVSTHRYQGWVDGAAAARMTDVQGVPTVKVAGRPVESTKDALVAAVGS